MEAGYQNWTQGEYAAAFQQGDESALAYFYREFHPALAHYANRWTQDLIIAREIASEALIKTWRMHWKLDSYGAIRAYLYKTVQNACLDCLEQEQKRAILHRNFQSTNCTTDTPLDHLVRSETYRIIHSALRELSPANRKVIIMHYLEGKTTGQIARELKLHPSTIKTQKMKGLQALRKVLLRPLLTLLYPLVKIFLPIL